MPMDSCALRKEVPTLERKGDGLISRWVIDNVGMISKPFPLFRVDRAFGTRVWGRLGLEGKGHYNFVLSRAGEGLD